MDVNIEIDELLLGGAEDQALQDQLAGVLDPEKVQAVSEAVGAALRARVDNPVSGARDA